MPGFDALYKQTVTVFNRFIQDDEIFWYPHVLADVHWVVDQSIIISTYGEQSTDNAMLHVMYSPSGGSAYIGSLEYMTPKEFRKNGDPTKNITFSYGDEFDFLMTGAYSGNGPIADKDYKKGFFNYMNKEYDEVFAITKCAKFNLIPHFEVIAR